MWEVSPFVELEIPEVSTMPTGFEKAGDDLRYSWRITTFSWWSKGWIPFRPWRAGGPPSHPPAIELDGIFPLTHKNPPANNRGYPHDELEPPHFFGSPQVKFQEFQWVPVSSSEFHREVGEIVSSSHVFFFVPRCEPMVLEDFYLHNWAIFKG